MKINIFFAVRNILKNRVNSLITIVGLSVSFTVLLLIFLYVRQEFSYNSFYPDKDRIFRVDYRVKYANGQQNNAVYLDQEVAKIIKEKIPQIQYSTAFRTAHQPVLKFQNQNFGENVLIAQPGFFKIFGFKILAGNRVNLFDNPDEIVITDNLADKLRAVKGCTRDELIGQAVFFPKAGNIPFIISAILENVTQNSSIQFDALIPYKYQNFFNQSNNLFGNSTVFYQVGAKDDAETTARLVETTIANLYSDFIRKKTDQKILLDSDDAFSPSVTALNQVYLDNVSSDNEQHNNKSSLFILMAVGALILIIACSNFILLSVGQSLKKAVNTNIRKMMGARIRHIFNLQFTENLIVVSASFFIASIAAYFLIPVFNQLAASEVYPNLIPVKSVLIFVFSCIILIVTLTSIIPVLKLNRENSGNFLVKTPMGSHKDRITGIFVTLQYCLSIILIILTIFIVRQTNYMKYKDLGFSSQNVIDLAVYHLNSSEKLALRNQCESYSGISNLTLTDRNYVSGESSEFIKNNLGENIYARILRADQNYVSVLSLKIIQGQGFTDETISSLSVLINEKLASSLEVKGNVVGQFVNLYGTNYRIIGLLKDFHYDSIEKEIEPLILVPSSGDMANFMFIRYNPAQLSQLIPWLKSAWEKIAPDKELNFGFWDEQLNQRYQAEEKWSQIIGYTAAIAIIISSLGLFGLTLLIINKRTKEIGVRKVNGAKVFEVMAMLNKDFVKWVAIAFVIAIPVAYFAMHQWLENFAYKTELSWWIFALAGLLALGIALLTVSWQSWKAATRNPVEALRYE
ncbi:MAG: ABC transporter permease [Prolixibacteraceae bacterium]